MTYTTPVIADTLRYRAILDGLYDLDTEDAIDPRMIAFRARQAAYPPLDYVPVAAFHPVPAPVIFPTHRPAPGRAIIGERPVRAAPRGPVEPTPLRRRIEVE